MNYLGYTYKKPSINQDGKWNYINVEFNTDEEFYEATSKIMNTLYKTNSDGQCIVLDGKGNSYNLEIIHATFDTKNNSIKVFPYDCKFVENKVSKLPINPKSDKSDKSEKVKKTET